jgi:UDP-N-acetylglucosamine 4,6-dehydratase/5-epimerase
MFERENMNSVLVTGGAGFFGHGFVREALNRGVERVCIYSRGEYAQALMRERFNDDPRLRFFIGDIRDKDRLARAMQGIDTVIAAAALKRIETSHYNPDEVVKTNVIGMINTIEAAQIAGVRKVVLVSTDKAAVPQSIYGYSKATAEALMLSANHSRGEHGPLYSVCRFGNVWCSTGSIVPRWREMIAKGQMVVPVTDPDCTRFFMRIEEAADLVYRTAQSETGGELAIPDLPAYRVGDLAKAMGVFMNVTGLPNFEKKDETMDGIINSSMVRRMSVDELIQELGRG